MSWLYRTGFEHGVNLPQFLGLSGNVVSEGVSVTNPKSGTYAYRANMASADTWDPPPIGPFVRADTTSARVSTVVSFHLSDITDLQQLRIAVYSEATSNWAYVWLQINSDGSIELRRSGITAGNSPMNAAGNLIDSLGPGTIQSASWYTVELSVYFGNSGAYDVAINKAVVMSGTGVDTNDAIGSLTTNSGARLRCTTQTSGVTSFDVDIDDFLIGIDETSLLTTTVGIPVHEALVPTSDIETGGTPSTGVNHWELVDEIPPGASDYNEFTAVAQRERYGLSDRVETGDVLGVGLWTTASDPTTSGTIRSLINSNATEVESGDLVLSNTPGTPYYLSQETDPDTALAWTTGGVNAVTVGARRTV